MACSSAFWPVVLQAGTGLSNASSRASLSTATLVYSIREKDGPTPVDLCSASGIVRQRTKLPIGLIGRHRWLKTTVAVDSSQSLTAYCSKRRGIFSEMKKLRGTVPVPFGGTGATAGLPRRRCRVLARRSNSTIRTGAPSKGCVLCLSASPFCYSQ